jgi:hypothetical protein
MDGRQWLCWPWLSPSRDCARSAARHGVLVGVRVRQLRAVGAPRSVVEKPRVPRSPGMGDVKCTLNGFITKSLNDLFMAKYGTNQC